MRSETWFKMASDIERVTRAAADPLNLRIPALRLEVRKNFFSQRVPESWNKIPLALKQATTAKAFRNAYHKHRQTGASAWWETRWWQDKQMRGPWCPDTLWALPGPWRVILQVSQVRSGSGIFSTLDPGWKKPGSGINIRYPHHWWLTNEDNRWGVFVSHTE